jgi:diguanylate cyclase (GGDEF)-like protein
MEIRDRKSIKGVAATSATAPAQAAKAVQGAQSAPKVAAPRDVVDIGGITEAELTPNVRRALTLLMAEVDQLRRTIEDANARIGYLEKLADEDPLVPVVNRRAFVRELTRMMAFSQRFGLPSCIVYFDINNMKQVNDTWGHNAGDAVIVAVSKMLLANVRATDVVGRLGGDELGVLLVQTEKPVAENKAAELAALIQVQEIAWNGSTIRVSVAYGVHAFAHDDNAGAVLDAADRAMYRSKSQMKGTAK